MAQVTEIVIFPDAAVKVTDTPECRSLMERVAQEALNDAYASAPVYTGRYQDSLTAVAKDTDDGQPGAALGSTSSFWHFVEYGAMNTPPYHTLGEAVRGHVSRYEEIGPGG
jgi:hypothetical protein